METPPPPSTTPPPCLRRRNSIAATVVIDPKTPLPIAASSPSSLVDLKLNSLKPSYTSLRDLISSPTASVYSPVTNGAGGGAGEITIRNRLVKQAAWSYLQPTAIASSPGPYGSQLLRRVWDHISAGLRFLSRVVDWIFQTIRIPLMVK